MRKLLSFAVLLLFIGMIVVPDIAVSEPISIHNNNTNDIEPGNQGYGTIDSLIVGRGVFTIIITVTCDEGTFYSDKTYGLIFGPFMLIL